MKRLLLPLLIFPAVAMAEEAVLQSPAYKECIVLANNNPTQALVKADEWLAVDNGIAAYHCRAMALYGLKRFGEAGQALTSLRLIVPSDNIPLRSFITKQAAQAWKNASRADAALGVMSDQLADMDKARGDNAANAKITADLLLERARLHTTYGKANLAARDLDRAVSLTPMNAEILLERAKTFEQLGDNGLARADVEAALIVNHSNAQAREMLIRLDSKR